MPFQLARGKSTLQELTMTSRKRAFIWQKIMTGREISIGREFFTSGELFSVREFFISRECFQRLRKYSSQQAAFLRQNGTWYKQRSMASSDGSSARDILRTIFGRIGDLSAAINQEQGFSLRRDTDLSPASLEDEVRVLNNHQVHPSNSSVPRTPAQSGSSMPATNTSAPLYTMKRNSMVTHSVFYKNLFL